MKKMFRLLFVAVVTVVILAVAYSTANSKTMVQYRVYCTDCENKGQTPYSYNDFYELIKLGEIDSEYSN